MGSILLLAYGLLLASVSSLECHPPGPLVPRPRNLVNETLLIQATDNLSHTLDAALNGTLEAGWSVENTSFSIGLIIHDQPTSAVPGWEYHYLSANNVNGTKNITRDSQYLIGSISKVITVYILLKSKLDLDSAITQYLPVLKNDSSLIKWEEITLRQLASQVAGIPPNYGFSEYYYVKHYLEALGLPHLEDDDYPPCGVTGLNGGCTRDQFLQGMLVSYPVTAPESRPAYSNIAFTLIAYAVEEETGKNYAELLRDLVAKPFGLSNTIPSPGNDGNAVIPPVDNSWGTDYRDNAPGGGLVSTLSDLSIFICSILDHTVMDTETEVLEWLKPSSTTGSLHSLVGMPWEIFRTQDLTPDHPHTVDIYAKAGAAYGYQSHMAVIDEYGIAVVVLTAGSLEAANVIYDTVLSALVPIIDQLARDQAVQYTGTFTGGTDTVSSVSVMQDQQSLVLAGLERNGTDILESLRNILSVAIGSFSDLVPSQARIYPVGIETTSEASKVTKRTKTVILQDWRIDWGFDFEPASELPGAGLSSKNCLAWILTDWIHYGSEPLDRMVFVLDSADRHVVGVEVPFLRTGLLLKA